MEKAERNDKMTHKSKSKAFNQAEFECTTLGWDDSFWFGPKWKIGLKLHVRLLDTFKSKESITSRHSSCIVVVVFVTRSRVQKRQQKYSSFSFCLSGNFLFEKAMSVPLASFAAAATLYVVTIWTEDTQIAPNHVWAILSAGWWALLKSSTNVWIGDIRYKIWIFPPFLLFKLLKSAGNWSSS